MSGKLDNIKQQIEELKKNLDSLCADVANITEDDDKEMTDEVGQSEDQISDNGDTSEETVPAAPVDKSEMSPEMKKSAEKAEKEREEDKVTDEEKAKNEEYVKEFMNTLGYKDDYSPDEDYDKVADRISHEYALEMPTDTEAREIEGDAVILLVRSNSKKAVKVGKKLGDILMNKKPNGKNNEDLLEAMRQAFLSLRDVKMIEDCEKSPDIAEPIPKETDTYEESFGGISLYDKAKIIFESRNGFNTDGSDYGFSDYISESMIESTLDNSVNESKNIRECSKYFGGKRAVNEADLNSEEFRKWHEDWVNRGSHMDDLTPNSFMSEKEKEYCKTLKQILSKSKRSSFNDYSKEKADKATTTDTSNSGGTIPTILKAMGGGINNYLNRFMPMSWIKGVEGAVGKGAKNLYKKAGGDKLNKAYAKAGGNKAAALATLGGLTFGLPGVIGGTLLGKGLQKAVDYGNRG